MTRHELKIADGFATVPHAQGWKRCLRVPRPSEPLRRGQQRRSHHACETHRPSLPAAETLCSRGDRRPKKQLGPPQPHTHSRCASNAPPDRPGRSARPRPAEGRHRPCRAQPPVRATGASSCGRKTNTLARKRVEVSWVEISTCQGNKHRLTGKTSEAVFVSFVWVN